MTPATDLSGTWSVAAFYRAIADAHLDLDDLSARCSADDDFCCVPTLVACGALPPGWPEAVAHRLVRRMIAVLDCRGTVYDRDAFVTTPRGASSTRTAGTTSARGRRRSAARRGRMTSRRGRCSRSSGPSMPAAGWTRSWNGLAPTGWRRS